MHVTQPDFYALVYRDGDGKVAFAKGQFLHQQLNCNQSPRCSFLQASADIHGETKPSSGSHANQADGAGSWDLGEGSGKGPARCMAGPTLPSHLDHARNFAARCLMQALVSAAPWSNPSNPFTQQQHSVAAEPSSRDEPFAKVSPQYQAPDLEAGSKQQQELATRLQANTKLPPWHSAYSGTQEQQQLASKQKPVAHVAHSGKEKGHPTTAVGAAAAAGVPRHSALRTSSCSTETAALPPPPAAAAAEGTRLKWIDDESWGEMDHQSVAHSGQTSGESLTAYCSQSRPADAVSSLPPTSNTLPFFAVEPNSEELEEGGLLEQLEEQEIREEGFSSAHADCSISSSRMEGTAPAASAAGVSSGCRGVIISKQQQPSPSQTLPSPCNLQQQQQELASRLQKCPQSIQQPQMPLQANTKLPPWHSAYSGTQEQQQLASKQKPVAHVAHSGKENGHPTTAVGAAAAAAAGVPRHSALRTSSCSTETAAVPPPPAAAAAEGTRLKWIDDESWGEMDHQSVAHSGQISGESLTAYCSQSRPADAVSSLPPTSNTLPFFAVELNSEELEEGGLLEQLEEQEIREEGFSSAHADRSTNSSRMDGTAPAASVAGASSGRRGGISSKQGASCFSASNSMHGGCRLDAANNSSSSAAGGLRNETPALLTPPKPRPHLQETPLANPRLQTPPPPPPPRVPPPPTRAKGLGDVQTRAGGPSGMAAAAQQAGLDSTPPQQHAMPPVSSPPSLPAASDQPCQDARDSNQQQQQQSSLGYQQHVQGPVGHAMSAPSQLGRFTAPVLVAFDRNVLLEQEGRKLLMAWVQLVERRGAGMVQLLMPQV